MNIALIGYGKMGKAIEEIAINNGHKILLKINSKNIADFNTQNLKEVDVIIEFSQPDFAFENIKKGLMFNKPVISGTTGWLSKYDEIIQLCNTLNGTFIHSNNFSIGVNLFFDLNEKLAKLMAPFKEYVAFVEETHHTEKKDAPSGTALHLTKSILDNVLHTDLWTSKNYTLSVNEKDNKLYKNINTNLYESTFLNELKYKYEPNTFDKKNESIKNENENGILFDEPASNDVLQDKKNGILVKSKRIGLTPGTHNVMYNCDQDSIEIKHTAHNRAGFAFGVILAAEYALKNKGIFSMKNVLNL